MRVIRGTLLLLLMGLGGTGVLAATGGLHLTGAALPSFDPLKAPVAAASAVAARAGAVASPSASPRPDVAASPVIASSEIVAVASQTDQKVALIDPATSTAS